MLLKVAINGARKPGVHPALPTTPVELAWAAAGAVAAGAGAIHFHVRRPDRQESLHPDDVARTLTAVRMATAGTPVGVSTGLWIVADTAERQQLVAGWTRTPDFASVNFSEAGAAQLAALLLERGVGVEAGLFDEGAAAQFVASGLAPRCLRILIEPRGPTIEGALASVAQIERRLDLAGVDRPRLLHGSGPIAWRLFDEAVARGYDTRVGLEDMLELPDGTRAVDNQSIVIAARQRLASRP